MFSFNSLGNNGHLGNQMFQYAFIKSMSNKHSRKFCIPPKKNFGSYYNLKSDINDYFNLNCDREITNYPTVSQRMHNFDKDLFENPPSRNTNYDGYFQSQKYFKHIENEIREDFQFKPNILSICRTYRDQIYSKSELISLHIRRGDYVTDKNFVSLDESYYKNALDFFDSKLPVLVFSDDIEWCESHTLFQDNRFTISKSKNPGIDMCLMTLCNYHIIANSSFSWWGSWLSKSKKTIAPKKWLSGDFSNWDNRDMYLSDWVVI